MNFQSALLSAASILILCPVARAFVPAECGATEYGWTVTAGAEEFDAAWSACVAANGTVWVTGVMHGKFDFDPSKRKDQKKSTGGGDIFRTRFDVSGAYVDTIRVGGKADEAAGACAIGPDGAVAIAGQFEGNTDFDPGKPKDRHRPSGPGDAFVSAYNLDGTYRWTRTFGAEGSETARAVAIDREGNTLLAGYFRYTVDFDPGPGRDRHTAVGGEDVFIVKLDSNGRHLWARTLGSAGLSDDHPFGVATDTAGGVIVTGYFHGAVDFDPGPGRDIHESLGYEDVFVTKLAADGSYGWTHTFGGGNLRDQGRAVAIDDTDNIYVAGYFRDEVDFDRRGDGDVRVAKGFSDIFVTSRTTDGTYRWTAHMGGADTEGAFALAIDHNLSQLVVTGPFSGTIDFDPGEAVDERSSINEHRDVFVTWLTLEGDYVRTETFGGTDTDVPNGVAVAPDSSVVVVGNFESLDADFDPTTGLDVHASNGNDDIFITKLYCGPCEAVERHSLTVKKDKIIAEVRALVPNGRVTVECTPTDPPGEPIETRLSIDGDNTGTYKLERLDKGEYACAITEVRDADGDIVCDEPAGRRVVNVK